MKDDKHLDLNQLSDLVIKKIQKNQYYSEISDEKLYSSIYAYLTSRYQSKLFDLESKISQNRSKEIPDSISYKEEYQKLQNALVIDAARLAAANRKELF